MLIQADARSIPLRDGCVQCVVSSPPYLGLRDYGVAGQIGLERSYEEYIAELVTVFREVRRVLADDGVLWCNLGDSYGSGTWQGRKPTQTGKHGYWENPNISERNGFAAKQLMGIPWRVAFALQADGWYLRSDVIWHKPNPMPESVTDRPTKSHEYLFLLTKAERYHYDAAAIAESAVSGFDLGLLRSLNAGSDDKVAWHAQSIKMRQDAGVDSRSAGSGTRNKRSVWTIPTMPYAGAHFATMPEALVEPCILAGSRLGDLVFDPFSGSGTVLAVAERLSRRSVGTDLNPAYHALAKVRTAQRGLRFTEASA
jgi:DNA modification methylase